MKYILWMRVSRFIGGKKRPHSGTARAVSADNDLGATTWASDCVVRARQQFGPGYAIAAHLRKGRDIIKSF